MYPNYYGNQLNTIIDYQSDIYSELNTLNTNINSLSHTCNVLLFCFVLSITIAFIRKIFAVGR